MTGEETAIMREVTGEAVVGKAESRGFILAGEMCC